MLLYVIFNTLSFIGVTVFILKFLFDYIYLKYQLRKAPTLAGLPFIGIAWNLMGVANEDLFEWFSVVVEKFSGNAFITWMGMQPHLNIQKPHHFEVILGSSVEIQKSTVITDLIAPWLGNGLFTSSGKLWSRQRRFLTPAFHFGILEEYSETMFDKAEILCNSIQNHVLSCPDKPIDIFDFACRFTLDVICKTAMGVEMNAQRGSMNKYSESLYEFVNLVKYRFLRPWRIWNFFYSTTEDGRKFKAAIQILHDFSEKVIKEKIDTMQKQSLSKEEDTDYEFGKRKLKSFLDLLLDASEKSGHPLSPDEIREQVDTFLFAGHDTTATALSWFLFAIGNELDIQKNVREEMQTVFGEDLNKRIKIADIAKLKYLDRVIKESMRLYPTVPFIYRELVKDEVFDGHTFPKGMMVELNVYNMHRDPEIWKNPTKFDPDRFLPENIKSRHPYAFVPFSAGPRNCIGQKFALIELKIALIAILSKWHVKSERSSGEVKLHSDFILRFSERLYFTPVNQKF